MLKTVRIHAAWLRQFAPGHTRRTSDEVKRMRNDGPRSNRSPLAHRAWLPALCLLLPAALLLLAARPALAQTEPYVRVASGHNFEETVRRLDAAIAASPLAAVTRASATRGAASLGVTIPGNLVIGVFAPPFAVRMLRASVDAGFEAPVRLYVVEHPDGRVEVRYRKPSTLFAPYRNADLDAMALELDPILEQIAGSVR